MQITFMKGLKYPFKLPFLLWKQSSEIAKKKRELKLSRRKVGKNWRRYGKKKTIRKSADFLDQTMDSKTFFGSTKPLIL